VGWNVKHFHEHLRRQHDFGPAIPGRDALPLLAFTLARCQPEL
jgi:hypothetical protein